MGKKNTENLDCAMLGEFVGLYHDLLARGLLTEEEVKAGRYLLEIHRLYCT